MQLRKKIRAPERFEDLAAVTSSTDNGTRPAFPRLLKEQVVPFNPCVLPAAFPTLHEPHPASSHALRVSNAPASNNGQKTVSAVDFDHGRIRQTNHSSHDNEEILMTDFADDALDPGDAFEHAMETSEEEETHPQTSTKWNELSAPLQLEIYENACLQFDSADAQYKLGLKAKDLKALVRHGEQRKRQEVYEGESIRLQQQDQLHAILRTDHAANQRPVPIGQALHEFYTNKYLLDYAPNFEYSSVNARDLGLAVSFLRQRHLNLDILRDWLHDDRSRQTLEGRFTKSRLSPLDSGYISEDWRSIARLPVSAGASLSSTIKTDLRPRKETQPVPRLRPSRPQVRDVKNQFRVTHENISDSSRTDGSSSQSVGTRHLPEVRNMGSDMLPQRAGERYSDSADELAQDGTRSHRLVLHPPKPSEAPKSMGIKLRLKIGSDGTAGVRKEKSHVSEVGEEVMDDPVTSSDLTQATISDGPATSIQPTIRPKPPMPVLREVWAPNQVLPSHCPRLRKLNGLSRRMGLSNRDMATYNPPTSAYTKSNIASNQTPLPAADDVELRTPSKNFGSDESSWAASLVAPSWSPITERSATSSATPFERQTTKGESHDHTSRGDFHAGENVVLEEGSASPHSFVTGLEEVPSTTRSSIVDSGSPVLVETSPARSMSWNPKVGFSPSTSNRHSERGLLLSSFTKQEGQPSNEYQAPDLPSSVIARFVAGDGSNGYVGDDETPTNGQVSSVITGASALKAAAQALVKGTESLASTSVDLTPGKSAAELWAAVPRNASKKAEETTKEAESKPSKKMKEATKECKEKPPKKVKQAMNEGEELPKQKPIRGKRGPYKKTREKMEREKLQGETAGTASAGTEGPEARAR